MTGIDDNTIARFITGECTDEELAQIDEWTKADKANAAELFEMERLYREAQAAAMPRRETEGALHRLHTRIEARERQDKARKARLNVWRRWAAAAAVIVVCIGLYALRGVVSPEKHIEYIYARATATTPRQITLPDGTKVWLNNGATLRYPKTFADTLREVMLTGEAYFEVAKNRQKPFVVDSRDMKVKVLGTVFNFNTNARGNASEVSLIEGSVEVSSHKSAGLVVLMPGQRARLDGDGALTVCNTDTRIAAVWHNELIPFDNCNVRQIANTLEQIYGVKIVVDPNINRNDTYSGQIMWKADIDTVLSLLTNTLPVTFSHRNGKIHIMPQR